MPNPNKGQNQAPPPPEEMGTPPAENVPIADREGGKPPPLETKGKKRLKHVALKGGKITVGKGEIVHIDENGFFEVDVKDAARLLTIPGYEEA